MTVPVWLYCPAWHRENVRERDQWPVLDVNVQHEGQDATLACSRSRLTPDTANGSAKKRQLPGPYLQVRRIRCESQVLKLSVNPTKARL